MITWLTLGRCVIALIRRRYALITGGASVYYRWQERPWVRLTVPDPAFPDPRKPQTVPPGDLNFAAFRVPPDDPENDWPVFLGRVERTRAAPDQPYRYTIIPTDRPYVGLVGESIAAPSGRARVQVGAERVDDKNRFAVFVRKEPTAELPDNASLNIDTDGNIGIAGETTIQGGLTIRDGALEFPVGVSISGQNPWSIYHSKELIKSTEQHQLRIEGHEVVVGFWSDAEKAFHPCLTVSSDGSVTVHGNLIVKGDLIEERQRAKASLSPEARSFMVGAEHSGLAGGGTALVPHAYRSAYSTPASVQTVAATPAPDTAAQALASTLQQDPNMLSTFVEAVQQNPKLKDALLKALKPKK